MHNFVIFVRDIFNANGVRTTSKFYTMVDDNPTQFTSYYGVYVAQPSIWERSKVYDRNEWPRVYDERVSHGYTILGRGELTDTQYSQFKKSLHSIERYSTLLAEVQSNSTTLDAYYTDDLQTYRNILYMHTELKQYQMERLNYLYKKLLQLQKGFTL